MSAPAVLFHVQHLLGIGHLRRIAALARATAARGCAVTVASGGRPVAGLDLGAARLAQLPPARAADESFSAILDETGAPIDDAWKARRRAMLLDLLDRLRPRALVIEMFPFGRRAFRFELLPLIEAARAQRPRPRIVCSVRDVLTARRAKRTAEAAHWARTLFDAVLVHGDPALIPFAASFPAADAIADRLIHTGYVASAPETAQAPTDAGRDEVIVSAGGGAVGAPLLEAALAAREKAARAGALRWRVLAGANLDPAAFAELAARDGAGLVVERARPDFPALLANCAVAVSQAGYNTMTDIVQARARAVVVPFARGGQTEQSLRAEAFARAGLVRTLAEDALSPERLAAAIDAELAAPRPSPEALALDGAARAAALIAAWAAGRDAGDGNGNEIGNGNGGGAGSGAAKNTGGDAGSDAGDDAGRGE